MLQFFERGAEGLVPVSWPTGIGHEFVDHEFGLATDAIDDVIDADGV